MFRNTFLFQGINLGSSISLQDDAFKALAEGRAKAEQIARALRVKIPTVTSGDIEVHCKAYNPQLWLLPDLAPKSDSISYVPNAPTLKSMKAS